MWDISEKQSHTISIVMFAILFGGLFAAVLIGAVATRQWFFVALSISNLVWLLWQWRARPHRRR